MQDEKNVANKDLGNFGFLMEFDKNIMFHFAQLAESNLYVNKKLRGQHPAAARKLPRPRHREGRHRGAIRFRKPRV